MWHKIKTEGRPPEPSVLRPCPPHLRIANIEAEALAMLNELEQLKNPVLLPIVDSDRFDLMTAVMQPLLRWLGDRGCFTRPELITIYVMMLVGSVVVTTGFAGTFIFGPEAGTLAAQSVRPPFTDLSLGRRAFQKGT